jgi:hypothetical protein
VIREHLYVVPYRLKFRPPAFERFDNSVEFFIMDFPIGFMANKHIKVESYGVPGAV